MHPAAPAKEDQATELQTAAKRWLIVCLGLYWCLLVFLVHMPMNGLHIPSDSLVDKVVHALLYGGLAFFLAATLEVVAGTVSSPLVAGCRALAIWLAIGVQGIVDEWTQPLTGRTFDLLDWASDLAGAAVVLSLFYAWRLSSRRTAVSA